MFKEDETLRAAYYFVHLTDDSIRFFLSTYNLASHRFFLGGWVGMGAQYFKFNQKVVGHPQYVCATVSAEAHIPRSASM